MGSAALAENIIAIENVTIDNHPCFGAAPMQRLSG
jgi:hypothetical protein